MDEFFKQKYATGETIDTMQRKELIVLLAIKGNASLYVVGVS
jgi:hypothetical protein